MKKVTKILTVVLLVAMIVMFASNVFAGSKPADVIGTIQNSANTANVDTNSIANMAGKIIAYLRNAAVIMGVIIIIILGIKYMTGSVEEKAGYQKSFVPLIVGIVVVVAATSIASFLFGMLG